ncbi:MAG: hypothetical protein ABIQ88_22495 [Chitinophagaceae bacterium]
MKKESLFFCDLFTVYLSPPDLYAPLHARFTACASDNTIFSNVLTPCRQLNNAVDINFILRKPQTYRKPAGR